MSREECPHGLSPSHCAICTGAYQGRRPSGPRRVRERRELAADVIIVAAGRAAYREYLKYSAYICQPNRTFFRDPRWMGFYADEEIKPEIAEISDSWEEIRFTKERVTGLRKLGGAQELRVADLIEDSIGKTRDRGEPYKVVLLSGPNDDRTLILPAPISNDITDHAGNRTAFTQYQRYVRRSDLEQHPATTSHLVVTPEEKG